MLYIVPGRIVEQKALMSLVLAERKAYTTVQLIGE